MLPTFYMTRRKPFSHGILDIVLSSEDYVHDTRKKEVVGSLAIKSNSEGGTHSHGLWYIDENENR